MVKYGSIWEMIGKDGRNHCRQRCRAGKNSTNIYTWSIFNCHLRLPEGILYLQRESLPHHNSTDPLQQPGCSYHRLTSDGAPRSGARVLRQQIRQFEVGPARLRVVHAEPERMPRHAVQRFDVPLHPRAIRPGIGEVGQDLRRQRGLHGMLIWWFPIIGVPQ